MKIDPEDPLLTAYAMGEVDDETRAAIEQSLRESPQSSQAIHEVLQTANALTSELSREPCEQLSEEQRQTVDAAIASAQTATSAATEEKIILGPWKQTAVLSTFAAAACLALGLMIWPLNLKAPKSSLPEFVQLERNNQNSHPPATILVSSPEELMRRYGLALRPPTMPGVKPESQPASQSQTAGARQIHIQLEQDGLAQNQPREVADASPPAGRLTSYAADPYSRYGPTPGSRGTPAGRGVAGGIGESNSIRRGTSQKPETSRLERQAAPLTVPLTRELVAVKRRSSPGVEGADLIGNLGSEGGVKDVAQADKIVVSVAGVGGRAYAVVRIALTGTGDDFVQRINSNRERLLDAVTSELSRRTLEEIDKPGFRLKLRTELLFQLNQILGGNTLSDVVVKELSTQQ